MRRLFFVPLAIFLAMGLSSAPALAAEPSVTGGGSTADTQFGFTAQSHRDGTVSGNAEFTFPGSSLTLHVRINCLVIIGDNAYMSGTTTEQTDGLAEGTEILFGVRDNDAGALVPDLISQVFFSPAPPFTCQTFHAPPINPVTAGNIEIRTSLPPSQTGAAGILQPASAGTAISNSQSTTATPASSPAATRGDRVSPQQRPTRRVHK